MRHRRLSQGVFVVVLALGCGSTGPAAPSPSLLDASPSPSITTSFVLPSATIPASQTPPATPMPTISPTTLITPTSTTTALVTPLPFSVIDDPSTADIDHFWAQYLELSCVEFGMEDYWDSVTQMSKDVEVILVGHPISIAVRPDPDRYGVISLINVAVDDVLKGNPSEQQKGVIQVTDSQIGDGDPDEWSGVAPVPIAPTLFFLRSLVGFEDRASVPVAAGDEYLYYTPGTHQNVLTEVAGKVYVPQTPRMTRWYGHNFFPLPLQGMAWNKLLDQVRAAINHGSVVNDVQHGVRFAC